MIWCINDGVVSRAAEADGKGWCQRWAEGLGLAVQAAAQPKYLLVFRSFSPVPLRLM